MAIQDGFVLVQSELFSRMRQHCEHCCDFNIPLQELSDGRVVTPTDLSSNSKASQSIGSTQNASINSRKRKASQSIGSTQNTSINTSILTPQSETETTWSQPPSQPSGIGPSLQSNPESPQSGIAPSESSQSGTVPSESSQSGTAPSESSKSGSAPLSKPLSEPQNEKRVIKSRRALALDRFVQNAPEGNKWRARQSELGLNTVEKYEDVIQGFSRRAYVISKRESCKELRESDGKLIVVGKKLAFLTRLSLDNADLQRSFAYFHVLILLSYCELLRQKGVSDEAIDELIQTIAHIRERDRKALLDTIPWIHQLIVQLIHSGWTLQRATELFFINAISISDLVRIRSDETFRSILEHLSADTFVKYSYDDCLTPSYSIPGLIASLLDSVDSIDQISLIDLYNALGYNLPDLQSSVEGIYKVHPAKTALISPGSPQFENLTHDSEEFTPYSTQYVTVDTSALARVGGSASNPRPQLQLPTQVKVPDTAQSIRFAMEGDIDGLKYLFSQGLASPRDVSNSRGFSLVRWALYGGMRNYKTVQFLLSWGAFVDEDSYQHVWDYAYRMKCSSTELAELRCITLNSYAYRDWVEEQKFPVVHNIIFGRSSKLLSAELDDNPNAVRVTDAMGRTALDWATALAHLSEMRLLIDRGSPLNTMDVSGRTTVLHAVDSHNDDALRILLEAGANPNPEVPEGLFRSSPLTAASFGGLVGMIKLLIKFGAQVDACNPEGRTALQAVASMQNVSRMQNVNCADILLAYGADMCYVSSNGHSPFTTAIIYNNHAVLKLFVDWCDTSRLNGLQLLPTIAESADAETMSILTSSDLLKQTTEAPRRGGRPAR